jgi:hypothetical protein
MPPIGVETLQKESDCIVGIPAKPVWRSKGIAVPPASNLWSVRIKSYHLKTPRPCAVESQVCIYSDSLLLLEATDLIMWSLKFVAIEATGVKPHRNKPVTSLAPWLDLILKDHKVVPEPF